ncbi:MAG: ABC transporter permease [Oscillospiraceae bacterium]|nr:ABC transporter permease [Oscillospiraceae bacterium]
MKFRNIFNKITLAALKKNRTRTIVTIIGVILSASMITAVTTFISSLQHYMLTQAIELFGDWETAYLYVNEDFYERIKADSGVKSAHIVQYIGSSPLYPSQENDDYPRFEVYGYSDEAFETLKEIKIAEGRLPENEREIVLPLEVSDSPWREYKIGDVITLELANNRISGGRESTDATVNDDYKPEQQLTPSLTREYTIVGFRDNVNYYWPNFGYYSFITKIDSENLEPDGFYNVYLKIKNVRKIYSFKDDKANKILEETGSTYGVVDYNREYLRALGIFATDSYNTIFYSFGAILIILIMVGSVLLIYNAFSISVSERTRQFGILSSVGATKKQLLKTVLAEGAFIGIIGIPLGIIAGIAGIGISLNWAVDMLQITDSTVLKLHVSVISLIAATAISGLTILISAYIPAKRATRISAIDSIKQTADVKIKPKALKTSKLTQKLFGLPGTLASKNFKRNKRRYRATVISLFVSIVLFISAGAFGMFMRMSVTGALSLNGFDISLTMEPNELSDDELREVYELVKTADHVTDSNYQFLLQSDSVVPWDLLTDRYIRYTFGYDLDGIFEMFPNFDRELSDAYFTLIFFNDEYYEQYIESLGLPIDEYTGENAIFPFINQARSWDMEDERLITLEMFKNDSPVEITIGRYDITFDYDEERDANIRTKEVITETQIKIKPVTEDVGMSGFQYSQRIIMPHSAKEKYEQFTQPSSSYISILFASDDPLKTGESIEKLIEDAGYDFNYYSHNAAEVEANARRILSVVNLFTYGFAILISLITVANIFNTITTNINLRRREFAMLKSAGMTNGGINRMMVFECLIYGIRSLLYGLPVSFGITYLIYLSVMQGMDVPFALPWGNVAIAVGSVFSIVFATMLYALAKVKKENTVDALRSEIL